MYKTIFGGDFEVSETQKLRIDLTKSITPWSAKLKLKRLAWNIVQAVIFKNTPKKMGRNLRASLLKMFGAKLGKDVYILSSVKTLCPWNLTVGDGCVIGADVELYNFAPIVIGDQTQISQRTFLCTGSHDFTDPIMPLTFEPIHIGSEVWIASECFVGPGRTIGNGVVVGARSVVAKDLPEWMVCAGHPCKPIKPRIIRDESEIQRRDYE